MPAGLRAILSLGGKIVLFFQFFFVRTKVVFFGVLRFISLMRSVISGSLQIETVFHVMLQHRTIRYFSACCLQTKANKLFLVVIAVFFAVQILGRINIDTPSCPQRIPKRL